MIGAGAPEPDDLVPVSVRLGTVVAPEDPEDWTRSLTWVAALGMLAGPAVALTWYLIAAPIEITRPLPGTWAVAITLVAGAAVAGSTQIGRLRVLAGTLAAGLLAALLVVVVGAIGPRVCYDVKPLVEACPADPTLVHAAAAALAGLAGCLPAALAQGLVTGRLTRSRRGALGAAIGTLVTALVVPNLF